MGSYDVGQECRCKSIFICKSKVIVYFVIYEMKLEKISIFYKKKTINCKKGMVKLGVWMVTLA